MKKKETYSFTAKVWKYHGKAAWYFVTLPKALAIKIRKNHGVAEEGWGRLKVSAHIDDAQWGTAIWFDTKANSYLLPIKQAVRKSTEIKTNDRVKVVLEIQKIDSKIAQWLKSTKA